MHMIVLWLAYSMNLIKAHFRAGTSHDWGGFRSPLGEGVQLAETRLVNIPHLNTPNRSTTPFISNHTCY